MAKDLRSYKTSVPVKIKWTSEDVCRLSDRTLKSQNNAAKDKLINVRYYSNYAKDVSVRESYRIKADKIAIYQSAIELELEKRRNNK